MKKSTGSVIKTSFTGTSKSGDLAEALADAIRQAEEAVGTTEPKVRWKLEEVSGEHGSLAELKKISVTISVK